MVLTYFIDESIIHENIQLQMDWLTGTAYIKTAPLIQYRIFI